jgi:hypothetical protein
MWWWWSCFTCLLWYWNFWAEAQQLDLVEFVSVHLVFCSKEGTTATFTSSFEGASRIREAATSLQWPANMVDCCTPAICTWSVIPPIVCGHKHDTEPYSIWYLWENHSCRSLYTQDSNFWRLDFGHPKISKFTSSCADTQIATDCNCRGKERESCATTTTVCHHHHLSFRGQEKVAIWRKTIRGQSTSCRVPNGKGWKESVGSNHITAWIHCSFWWRSSGWIPQLPSAWLPGTRRCLGEGSTWLPFKCVETALASPWHVDFSLYCKRWAAAFRLKFSCMRDDFLLLEDSYVDEDFLACGGDIAATVAWVLPG